MNIGEVLRIPSNKGSMNKCNFKIAFTAINLVKIKIAYQKLVPGSKWIQCPIASHQGAG